MKRLLLNKYISVYLLFLVVSFSFFSVALQNIFAAIFIFFVIFSRGQIPTFIKTKGFFLILISIPFFLTLLSVLQSHDLETALDMLLSRSVLLIIPLVVFLMEYEDSFFKRGVIIFVLSTVVSSLQGIIQCVQVFLKYGYFLDPDFASLYVPIHHPYFGAFIVLAIIFFVENYRYYHFSVYLKVSIITILVMAILISTALLSQLILVLYVSYKLYRLFHKWRLILLVFSVVCGTTLFLNYKEVNQIHIKSFKNEKYPRIVLWETALELIELKSGMFSGIGIGDYRKEYNILLRTTMDRSYPEMQMRLLGYNPHNQYIEFLIVNGFLGILYAIGLFFLLGVAIKTRDISFVFFMILLVSFSFTECILHRQWGNYLYAVFLPLLLLKNLKSLSAFENKINQEIVNI